MGLGIGPIPWRDIVAYGQLHGYDGDDLLDFIQVIREIDAGFREFFAEREKKQREVPEKKPGQPSPPIRKGRRL